MIICTTNLNRNYEVIDTVFILHSEEAGGFLGSGGVDFEKAFQAAKGLLVEKANSLGADAVIGVQFEHRAAVSGGLSDKQVLEFFVYGTAVKMLD